MSDPPPLRPTPHPHLAGLAPVYHGGIDPAEAARHGWSVDRVIDFSVSTNPLGPSPRVLAALRALDPAPYPDDACRALREALADRDGVPPEWILAANGSSEIIWLIAQAYLGPGDPALIVGPTYGEYARAARQAGAIVHEWLAPAAEGFAVAIDALIAAARTIAPKLLFIGNPNNPTGHLLPDAAIADLAAALPAMLIAVDEAYRPFVVEAPPAAWPVRRPNLGLIRSLTKDGGIAGLRLGYAIADPEQLAPLAALRPPWSVNAAAQAAGLAAIADVEHQRRTLAEVAAAKRVLIEGLTGLGYRVLPAPANFVLVEAGDGAALRSRLLDRGLCVRDCASFGLPAYIRIGVRPVADCERLIAALAADRGDAGR